MNLNYIPSVQVRDTAVTRPLRLVLGSATSDLRAIAYRSGFKTELRTCVCGSLIMVTRLSDSV